MWINLLVKFEVTYFVDGDYTMYHYGGEQAEKGVEIVVHKV
jgi:hypothetical protein